MAYPYICTSCLTQEHENCEESRDMPPKDSGLIIGGGVCVCQHQEKFGQFEKTIIEKQLGNLGEDK